MRTLLFVAVTSLFAAVLVACPTPKTPSGPPPEYEDPPPPSWLKEAGAPPAAPAPVADDAGAPSS